MQLSLLPIVTLTAFAQNSTPARTLIRAGHVLDVHTGNEAANQTIVVTGDRITSVAPSASTPKQPGDSELDLRS
ncbi:MAG: amidohydrolase family protein, partial [Acidobacteriaceae bacterium]|nr:amidohydrolase family protein [Acidobacteriaceae bacterium]